MRGMASNDCVRTWEAADVGSYDFRYKESRICSVLFQCVLSPAREYVSEKGLLDIGILGV
jgi:hypothetical protein